MNNSSPYTAAMTGCTFKLKEPYLANGFQMTNLVRFMELMVRVGDCKVFKQSQSLVIKTG